MANVHVEIKNIEEIKMAFRKAPSLMASELDKAIEKSIFLIQADSMRNTPVDTGRLRASHATRFLPLRGELEPETDYAFWVHEGTTRMPARPFLLEAVPQNEGRIDKLFEDAVQHVLNKIGDSV